MRTKEKLIFLLIACAVVGGLYAQTDFPGGDFWSLDAGGGMSNLLVEGAAFQVVIDPKLWLSPPLMVGSKLGINYSTDEILTFEGQVYLRWNFIRTGGDPNRLVNFFLQGGLGMVAAYRGDANPFDNVTRTRGSLMGDAAVGITIPLTDYWHIEPQFRGGYPHVFGVSLTVGRKFRLPEKTRYEFIQGETQIETRIEYREIVREIPPNEIIKRVMISTVEYILFGPDIGKYNIGIDKEATDLNEMALDSTAQMLRDNSSYRVRIEGHANPVTTDPAEADELMTLSAIRANEIKEQLKARGVKEEQMVIIAFGGTRKITSNHDIQNRNRRVEMSVIQIDTDTP